MVSVFKRAVRPMGLRGIALGWVSRGGAGAAVLAGSLIASGTVDPVYAAGKKPGANPGQSVSQLSVPVPVRRVQVGAVGTLPFNLPNGRRVDLAADLATLINTATTQTEVLSPTSGAAADPCNSWIELRSAVSTLDLNVAQVGVRFGYSLASGETSVVSSVNGSVRVDIGLLAMDFALYQCNSQGCSAVAATTASHITSGTDVSLEIDFGQITTGPSLVYNTPLGNVLRKIMDKGMAQLASSPALNRLGWRAKVREFNEQSGMVVFDQGSQSRIGTNQGFEVYAVTPSTGICDVYKAVAYLRTTQVNTLSSTAQVEQILDGRGIKEGDVVTIRSTGSLTMSR